MGQRPRAATVHLMANDSGDRVIKKVYRPGFTAKMFREYVVARYVAQRLSIVPRVLSFRPACREIFFSYLPGQRVLEWVLDRFGDTDLVLREFQSFHGLETNPQVAEAFSRFRQSSSEAASGLKQAIRKSYLSLHGIRMLHGSSDPRNIIYDGDRAFIIDFDHSRPSLSPAKLECRGLTHWYGITL